MNKTFDFYLKFFLLGCSLFYIPGQSFYLPQEMFFQYGVMGLLAVCLMTPSVRETPNPYLSLILGYALIHTVLFKFQPDNRMILNNMFMGFVLIKLLSDRISLDFKGVGEALAWFCVANLVFIILQILNIDPVHSSVSPENMKQVDVVGLMGLKSNLGVLAAVAFPIILKFSPFSAIICLPLLWFSKSSTCVLAFVLTVLFLSWFKSKKLFWGIFAFIVAAGVYYVLKIDMPTGQFSKRLVVWGAGIHVLASSNPWFGNGLGSWGLTKFTTIQENGQPQTWIWAHNTFIQYFFELGVAGFFLLIAYFKNMFSKIRFSIENHRTAVSLLIPLIITSFFHFPWHLGRFAGIFCFILASIEALLSKPREIYEKNSIPSIPVAV